MELTGVRDEANRNKDHTDKESTDQDTNDDEDEERNSSSHIGLTFAILILIALIL